MTYNDTPEEERQPLDFDPDQKLLPLDERFRQAEQYTLDLEPETEAQNLRRLSRLLDS